MKNKGFTLIEMLVSFVLSMVLVIILFQLILNLKEVYMSSGIKSELLNKQNIITNKIYKDLNEKQVINMENCDSTLVCINLSFSDGTTKTLKADEINRTIEYDNYKIQLDNGSYFGNISISSYSQIAIQNFIDIKIPVYNYLFKGTDFGINIIYEYNSDVVTNNVHNIDYEKIDSYTRIPYVRTDGRQKIVFDYTPKTTTEIRLDIKLTENSLTQTTNTQNRNIIGQNGTDSNKFNVNFGSALAQYKQIYYWVDKGSDISPSRYKNYDVVTNRSIMTVKSGEATFQGETITVETKTSDNQVSMVLLGTNSGTFNKYDTKIYSFQVYESDELIMSLIPAKRNSDNVIGLYDVLNNDFYTSNGSYGFIYE